jgi:thymidylate kinase
MMISFIGNDGSGKSTTIKALTEYFASKDRLVQRIPGFEHAFVECLKKACSKISGKTSEKLHSEYVSKDRNRVYYLWPYLVFLDCCFLLARQKFRPRTIVIFDRHPYDYVASFEELGVSSPLVRKLFLMIPKPKHIFLMDASPEIARERKKADHTDDITYYQRQRARYLALANEKQIPVLNTDSRSVQEVVAEVLQRLGPAFAP